MGPEGRLVIPVRLRREMGIRPGDTLLARLENGRLVLERPEHVIERLRAAFDKVTREVSLVDELIAERRDKARCEASE